MLKKFAVLTVAVSLFAIYIFSNGLFLGKVATIVKEGKSSGAFIEKTVYPFEEKDGVFKIFSPSFDYLAFAKDYGCKLAFIERSSEITSYYFYTKRLPRFEVIKGEKINVHVAVSKDQTVIGSPIIYGGY